MKSILLFIGILYQTITFSQNQIYVGTSIYDATEEWEFTVENGFPEIGNASITFAKNEKGAYLLISVDTHHPLKGNVMIYLENGEVIKCFDTKLKDMYDGLSIGIYNLNSSEIEKMKKSNIASLRVSVFQYSSSIYSFTIKNYYTEKLPYGQSFKMFNTTATDITNLMNKN